MINKTKSGYRKKFKMALIAPVAAVLLLLFSCTKASKTEAIDQHKTPPSQGLDALTRVVPRVLDRKVEFVKQATQVLVSGEVKFQLFDTYGNLVLKGWAKEIDLSSFQPGRYFIELTNQGKVSEFTIR